MLNKVLKILVISSVIGVLILVVAAFLTKSVKKEIKKAETTVPDQVEFVVPKIITEKEMAKKIEKKLKKKWDIYSEEYQKAAKSIIDKWKKENLYSLDKPLIIVNPFGTNKTGLYLYFKHHIRVKTNYNISVKSLDTEHTINIPDFSAYMFTNKSNMPLAEQEGQVIGLLAGVKNYVSIYLYDEEDKMVAKAGYKIELPADEEEKTEKIEAELDRELEQLSSGLFAVFGLDEGKKKRSLKLYDNQGILRARLAMVNGFRTKDVNLKTIDDKIFYGIDERRYALVNPLGRAEKIFSFQKGKTTYGDFDFTPANRYMVTFTKGVDEKEGVISSIDLYDGKTRDLFDLRKLLSEYSSSTEFHLTSIRMINDQDMLVSERNSSTIFRINNVFRRPEVKAVLSGGTLFSAEKMGERGYHKNGEFPVHTEQSSVYTDRGEKLDGRKYHIHILNHKLAGEKPSYYYYLVNEEDRSFTLENEISLPYPSRRGSVTLNGDNIIFSLGDFGVFMEYNKDNNRLAKYRFANQNFYKVMKISMKGSWFSK